MKVKAKANYIKMSPRKVRLVATAIRGMQIGKALDQLAFTQKNAVLPISKLLHSAIANAENNFELDKNNLFVEEITVNEGPTLKRFMPRARGRATPVRKRTSHIGIVLGELVDSGDIKAKKQKIDEPVKLGAAIKENEGIIIKDKKADKKKGEELTEKGKVIVDPRGEGKGKHTKIEGSSNKGFSSRIFRRKSG